LPSDVRFVRPKCTKNSISAGPPPQTLLGELTALPRPLAGLKGPTSKRRGGKGRSGGVPSTFVLRIYAYGNI